MPRVAFRRKSEVLQSLRRSIFSTLDEHDLDGLATSAQSISYQHGEVVWAQGEENTFACVVSGSFDVVHHGLVVDTLGPGQPLGLSALWHRPHHATVRARKTDSDRAPELLLWDMTKEHVPPFFHTPRVLAILLQGASSLIHHLNDLQLLYRRRCGAAAYVAIHMLRLARFQEIHEVEIGQKELGELTGYDPRTVRMALTELTALGCLTNPRRSVYMLDFTTIGAFLENEKNGAER